MSTSAPAPTPPAASVTPTVTYTQLDKPAQLQIINARLLGMESQYLALNLRVVAPAPGDVLGDQDLANLAELATSITKLHDMVTALG